MINLRSFHLWKSVSISRDSCHSGSRLWLICNSTLAVAARLSNHWCVRVGPWAWVCMYVWLCVLDECLARMHLALITCNSGATLQRPHVHLIRLRLRLQHGDMATCNVPPATGWLYLDIDAKPACCLAYHQVPPSLRQAKSCIMSHLSHPVVELAVRKLTTKRKRESDDGYVGMGMLGIAPIRAPLAIAVLSIWCNYIACRMLWINCSWAGVMVCTWYMRHIRTSLSRN